jgi:hypothetical protein
VIIGELLPVVSGRTDFDFSAVQLLMTPALPKRLETIPFTTTIVTVVTGRLCRDRRDVSSFVSAFAHQLQGLKHPTVKCKSLIALGGLLIPYAARVDLYVLDMCACVADKNGFVRWQGLPAAIRLVPDDSVKLGPLLSFQFVSSLVDSGQGTRAFPHNCPLDSIFLKKARPFHCLDCVHSLNYRFDRSFRDP